MSTMPDKILTLTLPASTVNVILASLAKQPFEIVAPVIGEIKRQCDPQMAPPAETEKTE